MRRVFTVLLLVTLALGACGSSDDGVDLRIDEEFEVNGAKINLQSIKVKENRTNLYGSWFNNTPHEAHINYLAPLTIYQGDETIEIRDEEKLNRKVKSGVGGTLDLRLELINETDDIRLVFYNTDDDTTKEIVVNME